MWGFDPNNGHLGQWDSGEIKFTVNNQFLILGVVLAVVWFLLSAMFIYYLLQFKKVKTDQGNKKLYGDAMLWTTLALGIVEVVDWILIFVFWADGKSIFGTDGAETDQKVIIALVVIGFVILASAIVMMWFFLPYYGIAFDGKRILFMGEDIMYSSITKIVSDTVTGATYVNYTRGKRLHKKLRFSSGSMFGQFVKANAELTGHPVEELDEKAYFETLMKSDRVAEKKLDEDINNKLKNKSSKDKKDK